MVCPFFFWMRNAMKFNAYGDAFEWNWPDKRSIVKIG